MRPKATFTTVMIVAPIPAILAALGVFIVTKDAPFSVIIVWPLLFLSILMAGLFSAWYVRRLRRDRFADREAMVPVEIVSRYYQDAGLNSKTIVRVWVQVAKALSLPPDKLRPTDRFDSELAPLREWNQFDEYLSDLFLETAIAHGANSLGEEIKALETECKTLGQLVMWIAKTEPFSSSQAC